MKIKYLFFYYEVFIKKNSKLIIPLFYLQLDKSYQDIFFYWNLIFESWYNLIIKLMLFMNNIFFIFKKNTKNEVILIRVTFGKNHQGKKI
jgi:hypothetical protein